MKRSPLTKDMVERGYPKHAPCLGEDIIMSRLENGVRVDGFCRPCHDYRNCRRVQRGEPPLPPLIEPVEVVSHG